MSELVLYAEDRVWRIERARQGDGYVLMWSRNGAPPYEMECQAPNLLSALCVLISRLADEGASN